MSRCIIGPKKVARYARETGLDVVTAMVRGGTDHRVDLCLADGTIACLFTDGEIRHTEHRWSKDILEPRQIRAKAKEERVE